MMNASDFVSLMTPKEQDKSFKLATVVDISQNNTAIIQFDGEEEPSSKSFAFLDSYQANIGDRILLSNVGGTYVIIGKVQYIESGGVVVDDNFYKTEIIRTRKGLGDQGVIARRNKPYGSPDRLYNVYVENKVVKTATRDYYSGQQAEWIDSFEVGPGTSVAIALDGDWKLSKGRYGLVTKGNPYLFWVDLEGKMHRQIWNNTSTKEVLAENVTKVKSVRGWKNINFADRDDGLIVGYIKDNGKVYYRNYCEQVNSSFVWEKESQIEEFKGVAVDLNLFVTNDYRTGFVIEDNLGKIHWIITERNWAGMAIRPDTITANPVDVKIDFIPIKYYDGYIEDTLIRAVPTEIKSDLIYASTDNMFTEVHNQPTIIDEVEDWGKELIIKTQHRLYNVNNADFEITDTFNRSYYTNEVTEISDKVYKLSFLEFNNFNNIDVQGVVKFKGLFTTNGIDLVYEPFEKTFYPLNLVPTEIPLPTVEVIYNE